MSDERSAYTLAFDPRAEEEYRKLDGSVRRRVQAAIRSLANEQRPHGCRYLVGRDGLWRIRIGDYRVVYTIDDGTVIVPALRERRPDRIDCHRQSG